MARKPDVQYIRFYTDGSAARRLEPKAPGRKTRLPKAPRQKKYAIYIDPIALGGILVSAVLLVMMIVGSVQLFAAQQQQEAMEEQLRNLRSYHTYLSDTYEADMDLELIEQSALAMGMVPEENIQTITVTVVQPAVEAELTLWERITVFFAGLFA